MDGCIGWRYAQSPTHRMEYVAENIKFLRDGDALDEL